MFWKRYKAQYLNAFSIKKNCMKDKFVHSYMKYRKTWKKKICRWKDNLFIYVLNYNYSQQNDSLKLSLQLILVVTYLFYNARATSLVRNVNESLVTQRLAPSPLKTAYSNLRPESEYCSAYYLHCISGPEVHFMG